MAILQLTILCSVRSDMSGDTNDYLLCSIISRDTTTDYPIYRLSALKLMVILQTTLSRDTATDYLLYLRCSTLSGDTTSHYLLYSARRYVSRRSRLLIRRRSLPVAGWRSRRWVSQRSRRAVSFRRSRRCGRIH
jgi:hypothetical protein